VNATFGVGAIGAPLVPPRKELWFRLLFSVAGLGMLASALFMNGIPNGPALVEVAGFAGLFFGSTAVWAGWKLWPQPP